MLELDDQLVNEVIRHHYQQYRDAYNVMVFRNYVHVYPNRILEQGMPPGIDVHEV
jgi:hypothetical protein